jgi:uncharacterized membrane protein
MTHQQAVCVVAAPLELVERRLREVGDWPQFVVGLERVTETSFGRYTFAVRNGTSPREIEVALVVNPREHRIGWRALARPRFDGEFRLSRVQGGRTRVALTLTAEPTGFFAGLSELVRLSHSTAALNLQRLDALLTSPAA